MKTKSITLALFLIGRQFGYSQDFANLDFEAANVSGYSTDDTIPTTNAFPDWTSFFFSNTTTDITSFVYYNAIPLGSATISVVDGNAPAGFGPLQGNYSAYLFGSYGYSAGISKTGLVPIGTQSIQMDVYSFLGFNVMLNGQTLNMIPLATNSPNDIVYGADVSMFANQVATLSLIAPPLENPNGAEFDSIVFSTSSIPEPSELTFGALGALIIGFGRWRNSLQ